MSEKDTDFLIPCSNPPKPRPIISRMEGGHAAPSEANTDVESVKTNVEFVHPLSHKRSVVVERSIERSLSVGSVLPAMELSWHDITVLPKEERSWRKSCWGSCWGPESEAAELEAPTKRNWILKDVYGVARPGEVLALMGCSGAGKTSLLNVLTARNLNSVYAKGTIRLNGYEVNSHILRRISAYVEQDDLFIGSMTVLEHLRFMALMKMGKDYSRYEREKRVQSVMTELGLKKIANTMIGWPHRLKGISGGERKRLAFASEIMTSGLDSFLAQQVIQVLKNLARRKNMTIVVTIHQPSSQIFEMFDRICLIAEGKLAFLGTTAECTLLWATLGYPMPDNFNPADHFIDSLSMSSDPNKGGKIRQRIDKICNTFYDSQVGRQLLEVARGERSSTTSSSSQTNMSHKNSTTSHSSISMTVVQPMRREAATYRMHRQAWTRQLLALSNRAFRTTWRDPMLLRIRIFQTLLIALLLGVVYFDTPIKQSTVGIRRPTYFSHFPFFTQSSDYLQVMNVNGLLFAVVGNMNFLFQFAAVNVFCDELPVFMREHAANLYRVDTYFLSKNIAELPQYLLYPIIFSSVIYWMAGFERDLGAFGYFTLANICVTNVAISISYFMSITFGAADVAIAVMPVIVIPLLAFGGFYINQETLPAYFFPLKYLSYFGYGFEILAVNEWTRVGEIPGCEAMQIANASAEDVLGFAHCYKDGADVLERMGFSPAKWLFDFVAMLALILIIRIFAYISLVVRSEIKR